MTIWETGPVWARRLAVRGRHWEKEGVQVGEERTERVTFGRNGQKSLYPLENILLQSLEWKP